MNRRTRIAETVAIITRMVDRTPGGRTTSAFTIAATLDKLQRAATKIGRLHEAECNGDHERCDHCAGQGGSTVAGRFVDCAACHDSGRKSEDETKAWLLARDKAERRCERLLRDLGFLPPSDTTGNPKVPTWEIDRDPRVGPLRIFDDQADRKRSVARVVFPVERF